MNSCSAGPFPYCCCTAFYAPCADAENSAKGKLRGTKQELEKKRRGEGEGADQGERGGRLVVRAALAATGIAPPLRQPRGARQP